MGVGGWGRRATKGSSNGARIDSDVPARIYRLSCRALRELLQGGGADVGQVVGRRARDDTVPDDGLVRRILAGGPAGLACVGPLSGDVHKDLLGVPREETGQVGVEAELDDGVLLLFGRVVVGSALDDLHVGGFQRADGGGARGEEVGGGDEGGDDEGDGREEAEGVLETDDGAVHGGGGSGTGGGHCVGRRRTRIVLVAGSLFFLSCCFHTRWLTCNK